MKEAVPILDEKFVIQERKNLTGRTALNAQLTQIRLNPRRELRQIDIFLLTIFKELKGSRRRNQSERLSVSCGLIVREGPNTASQIVPAEVRHDASFVFRP